MSCKQKYTIVKQIRKYKKNDRIVFGGQYDRNFKSWYILLYYLGNKEIRSIVLQHTALKILLWHSTVEKLRQPFL